MLALTAELRDFIDYACSAECSEHSTCCVLQCFAGCGKTTAIRHLAQMRFDKGLGGCLFITVTKELKDVTRELALKQNGMVVENVHSLVRNQLWVGHDCINNEDIEAYLKLDPKPAIHPGVLQHVSMVVFDEIQNMNPLSYAVINCLLQALMPKPILFVPMGDFFQWLFGTLMNSSTTYMCHPEQFFPSEHYRTFRSSRSLRLTHDQCSWINTNLNPNKIAKHYPACWEVYGEHITRFWGDGIHSLKCKHCNRLHDFAIACEPPPSRDPLYQKRVHFFPQHNRFKSLLPPIVESFIRKHHDSTLVLVNGLKKKTFQNKYAMVGTPFSHIGCESKHVVCCGLDYFAERVCSNSASNKHDVDWPLSVFCQMYVSCTRASDVLFIIGFATSFFTLRDAVISPTQLGFDKKQVEIKKEEGATTIIAMTTTNNRQTIDIDLSLCSSQARFDPLFLHIQRASPQFTLDTPAPDCSNMPRFTTKSHAIAEHCKRGLLRHIDKDIPEWQTYITQKLNSPLCPPQPWLKGALELLQYTVHRVFALQPLYQETPIRTSQFHCFRATCDYVGRNACLFLHTGLLSHETLEQTHLFAYTRYLLLKQTSKHINECYVLDINNKTVLAITSSLSDPEFLFQFFTHLQHLYPMYKNPIDTRPVVITESKSTLFCSKKIKFTV